MMYLFGKIHSLGQEDLSNAGRPATYIVEDETDVLTQHFGSERFHLNRRLREPG
jgi:hypothetical protein